MTKINLDKYTATKGAKFFKAVDMATDTVRIKIGEIREAQLPQTGDTLILDFNYKAEERSIPLNKTNLKALITKFGDNTDKWAGETVTLLKVKAPNPKQGGALVDTIRIS